jgi:hypothetical protein
MTKLTGKQFSELRSILRPGDPDADLCRRQIDEASRDIYGLVVYENIYGWCYRADTNLINNGGRLSSNFGHGAEGRAKAVAAANESGRSFRVERPVDWSDTKGSFNSIPITPES